MYKKIISILVSALMVMALIPAAAFASTASRAAAPAVKDQTQVALWDFEANPLENGWEFRDEDGDNNNWQWINETYYGAPIASSGEYSIRSRSYFGTALTPDNWAVSPAVELPEAETIELSVQVASYLGYYPETFALYAFVDGAEEPVALGDDMQSPASSTEFVEYTADLSEYAGQSVQVAVRHYNCEDQYMFYVDDVTITTDAVDPVDPVDPTEPPADPTPTPVDPTEPPVVDEHKIVGYYFETDPEAEGWEFVDQDGDGNNWQWMDDVSYYAYEGHGSIASNSYLSGTALTPDNWALSPEIELRAENNSVTFYAFGRGGDTYCYEHFAVYAGTDIDNMTEVLAEQITGTSYQQYTVDLTGYENQTVRIAIRHFNCTNMYALNVDQFEVWGDEGDTPADPQIIDAIEINDFVEPAWGENPFFGVTVPEGANYTLESATWNWWSDEDFGELTETDTFDHADYEYTMLFVVTPNEGYEFSENAVVTINGEQSLVDGSFTYIETDSATFYTIGFYVEEPAPATGIPGDVDMDGEVTTADALMALRYVMGLIELNEDQLAQAEVTGDGIVNVVDPLLILRHALGLIETFPAEEA